MLTVVGILAIASGLLFLGQGTGYIIDEANRVFGFDGWDRETVSAECVWQDARIRACSYAVRVRITVRAGKTRVSREGTGIGHGTGATVGEAHESALKEAETDATKRALITFGNLFGLALYDKEQAGVGRAKAAGAAPVVWALLTGNSPPQVYATPQQFCSAAKAALRQAQSLAGLEALWSANAPTIAQLHVVQPQLRTPNGSHYADLLDSLYRQQRDRLEQAPDNRPTAQPAQALELGSPNSGSPEELPAPNPVPNAALLIPAARRIRDPRHLRYVLSLPCLVCGRSPGHAHHLRFIEPRSLGSKPSDQWTVPLCPIHHRSLHDAGREDEWWQAKGIDAKAEAEKLWAQTHDPNPAPDVGDPQTPTWAPRPQPNGAQPTSPATGSDGPKAPPADNQGEPIPLNLRTDIAGLSSGTE